MPGTPGSGLDRSLASLREGYGFIGRRTRRFGSDVVETRLLQRPTMLLTGADAAPSSTTPSGSSATVPRRAGAQDAVRRGRVQSRDGEAHRVHKSLFMSLLSPAAARRIAELAAEEWHRRAAGWASAGGPVVVHDQAREIHCVAICAWAGVPLPGAARRSSRRGSGRSSTPRQPSGRGT